MQTQLLNRLYSITYTVQQHRVAILTIVILLSVLFAFAIPQIVLAEDSCGGTICPPP